MIMMVMMMVLVVMMMALMLIMVFSVFIVVIIVVVMVSVFIVIIIVILMLQLIAAFLNLLNPGCTGGDTLKIKSPGVKYVIQLYVTVVTLQDACAGLQCTNNLADAFHFIGTNL